MVKFGRFNLEVKLHQIRKAISRFVVQFCRWSSLITSQIFLALASNALEVHNVPPPTRSRETPPEATKLYALDLPGHRTDIRTLSLSSDDMLLASASNGNLSVPPGSALSDKNLRFPQDLEHQNYNVHSHAGLWPRNLQYIPSQ